MSEAESESMGGGKVAVAILVLVAVLLAAGVGYAIGRDESDASPNAKRPVQPRTTSTTNAQFVQRCVKLWNAPPNDPRRSTLRDWRKTRNVYVHLGPAADFPGECQVTAGITGQGDVALIFQQTGGVESSGPTYDPGGGLRVRRSALPRAEKTWNAQLQADGTLSAGGG